ncbi:MAG: helix-turn-helix domain-containing protein [Actinomycetota bacterium]
MPGWTGAPGADVVHAWQRLLSTGGAIGVGDLAQEVGWTPRHLGNRFAAEVGLSPKAAARVVRFDRARRRLEQAGPQQAGPQQAGPQQDGLQQAGMQEAGSDLSLATLAADGGYYDQAHLARDFRALAGCSPTQWRAEEFRNVQAWGPSAASE